MKPEVVPESNGVKVTYIFNVSPLRRTPLAGVTANLGLDDVMLVTRSVESPIFLMMTESSLLEPIGIDPKFFVSGFT